MDHSLVHTGQNWDKTLSDVFFTELRLREPDRFLRVDTSSLGRVLGGVLVGVEAAIADLRPDALLVLGDTNSCIAALMARRLRVPVYHMEAGNRCFDLNVPEETNRRLVDHVADFNLVYTEHARRNLLAEGLHPRRILHTGSPMREVLEHYRPQIERSRVLNQLDLTSGRYVMVSAHGRRMSMIPLGCGGCSTASPQSGTAGATRCWFPPIRVPVSGLRPWHPTLPCWTASHFTNRSG